MSEERRRVVLVLRSDGAVLGAGDLQEGDEPVVVPWVDDGPTMAAMVAEAREPALSAHQTGPRPKLGRSRVDFP